MKRSKKISKSELKFAEKHLTNPYLYKRRIPVRQKVRDIVMGIQTQFKFVKKIKRRR